MVTGMPVLPPPPQLCRFPAGTVLGLWSMVTGLARTNKADLRMPRRCHCIGALLVGPVMLTGVQGLLTQELTDPSVCCLRGVLQITCATFYCARNHTMQHANWCCFVIFACRGFLIDLPDLLHCKGMLSVQTANSRWHHHDTTSACVSACRGDERNVSSCQCLSTASLECLHAGAMSASPAGWQR